MAKVAVMGYGVVGSGVCEVLKNHLESINKKINEPIELKYILDIKDFPKSEFSDKFTKDFDTILSDDEIRVVAEVMGGIDPAFDYVKRLLLKGKSVVTSNKELVAEKGAELLDIASKNNVNFLFEASVGGGIPIIRPISQCLAANDVVEIAGILNGTTNFILTKMIKENMDFSKALLLAQELGYAEKDPSADINGDDACRKICVLASLAYGKHIYPKWVHTKGISNISLEDAKYASILGGVIKLIGEARKNNDGKVEISVEPMLVSNESQLSSVDDVFNGILVKGDATGDIVFYGKGAGKLPTASAVVADIIDCVKHLKARKQMFWKENNDENYVALYEDIKASFYIRFDLNGNSESIIDKKFSDIQKFYKSTKDNNIAIITPIMKIRDINRIINEIENENIKILSKIRVADL